MSDESESEPNAGGVDSDSGATPEEKSDATDTDPDESQPNGRENLTDLPLGVSPADIAALRTAENASEREYDKLVSSVEEIDDKAMRTLRTSVIVLGFVVSAVGISGPDAINSIPLVSTVFGFLGVLSLFVTILLSIGAYTMTGYDAGVGPEYRKTILRAEVTEREALSAHISLLNSAIESLRTEIDREGTVLSFVQLSLMAGTLCLVTAAAALTSNSAFGVDGGLGGLAILGSLLVSLLLTVGLIRVVNEFSDST